MGEIAEMMLDGTLCEGCGEYIGTDNGFPTRCAGCGGNGGTQYGAYNGKKRKKREQCHVCNKRLLDKIALRQHMNMKHGSEASHDTE